MGFWDGNEGFLVIGAIVSFVGVICFFVLCANVASIKKLLKLHYELAKAQQIKNEQKEAEEDAFKELLLEEIKALKA